MRVAQLIDSLYVGGAERLQLTYAEAAITRGEIPTVISLARFPGTPIPDQVRASGARLVEITGRNLVDPKRFAQLVSFLHRERFDALHAHLTSAIILGVLAGWLTHTPVVATLHNTMPDDHIFLETIMLFLGAKRIIAVGDVVAQAYQKRLPGRRIEVIYNPVQPNIQISEVERLALRHELSGETSRPIIVSVGRLEPQKGMFDLLSAMAFLRVTHDEAILLIVGQGSLKKELENKIDELGLRENVRLLGVRDDIPRILAASDIFALASHWEGMPISVLEAMSARLPVVATYVGDIPQIVTPATGLLVEPHRPQEFAETLQILLDDPAKRIVLGEAGQALIASRHSPDRWLDSLSRVYSQL